MYVSIATNVSSVLVKLKLYIDATQSPLCRNVMMTVVQSFTGNQEYVATNILNTHLLATMYTTG